MIAVLRQAKVFSGAHCNVPGYERHDTLIVREVVAMLWIKYTAGIIIWLAMASTFLALFGLSDEGEVLRPQDIGDDEERQVAGETPPLEAGE